MWESLGISTISLLYVEKPDKKSETLCINFTPEGYTSNKSYNFLMFNAKYTWKHSCSWHHHHQKVCEGSCTAKFQFLDKCVSKMVNILNTAVISGVVDLLIVINLWFGSHT